MEGLIYIIIFSLLMKISCWISSSIKKVIRNNKNYYWMINQIDLEFSTKNHTPYR